MFTSQMQQDTYYAVYSCVWRLGCLLKHGGGALGIFKSPVSTYNQAWTFSLSASHYFSFLSKRSGRRMPRASQVLPRASHMYEYVMFLIFLVLSLLFRLRL